MALAADSTATNCMARRSGTHRHREAAGEHDQAQQDGVGHLGDAAGRADAVDAIGHPTPQKVPMIPATPSSTPATPAACSSVKSE